MASFGESLKRERELREISLREISDATKINIRYLEALEENHFDILPGGLFNKGFIRAYARYIGVDGEAMVDRYLSEIASGERHAPELGFGPPPIHRPVETVRRRAEHQEPAAPGETSAPSITFAETQPPARPEVSTAAAQGRPEASTAAPARPESPAHARKGPEAAAPASRTRPEPAAPVRPRPDPTAQASTRPEPSHAPGRREGATPVRLSVPPPQPVRTATAAALAAVLEAPRGGMYPAAVSAIEAAAPDDPGSRVLTWILALVGGAAVLFLVLSLVMRRDAPQTAASRQGHDAQATTAHGASGAPATAAGRQDHGTPVTATGSGSGAAATTAHTDTAVGTSSAGPISPPPPGLTREGAAAEEEPRAAAAGAPAHKRAESRRAESERAESGRADPGRADSGRAGRERATRAPVPPAEDAPAGEETRAAEAQSAAGAAAGGERSGRGPMDLQVETTDSTWVQVICDGRTAINRVMLEGEAENLACLGSIRVSTINAGAVRLSVNGAPCLPLGDEGKRVYGYTIRIDDFSRICLGSRKGGDGRN
jgi:cytoskeletal protein RodZ